MAVGCLSLPISVYFLISLLFCLSISVERDICLSFCLSVFVLLSVCLFVFSNCLSVICLSALCLSIYLSASDWLPCHLFVLPSSVPLNLLGYLSNILSPCLLSLFVICVPSLSSCSSVPSLYPFFFSPFFPPLYILTANSAPASPISPLSYLSSVSHYSNRSHSPLFLSLRLLFVPFPLSLIPPFRPSSSAFSPLSIL